MEGLWTREQGPDGPYYRLNYTIAIQFGGTELRARIEWVENVSLKGIFLLVFAEIDRLLRQGYGTKRTNLNYTRANRPSPR